MTTPTAASIAAEVQSEVEQALAAQQQPSASGDTLATQVEAETASIQAALALLKTSSNVFAPETIDARVASALELHVGNLAAATAAYREG